MSEDVSSTDDDLAFRVAALEARLNQLGEDSAMAADLDVAWLIVSALLVFFMQVGFAMLEVGSVSSKNTKAVLIKNIADASLGALCWWLFGFALAYGDDSNGFIGTNLFALAGGENKYGNSGLKEAEWVFDWAFAATSVTIVSGAIAERVKIASYVAFAIVMTSFIYPMVVHWAWQSDGWASPYRTADAGRPLLMGCGAADFAGSGVVHMVGGMAALVAAIAVGPRKGRFRSGQVCRLRQQSPALQTLGTLILWVGWYAFNAGSTISISNGRSVVAARAVVSTTLGPSAGVVVMVIIIKIVEKKFDTRSVNNGILAGLVAITAGAPLMDPEAAFVIGIVSSFVYYFSANLLLKLQIDDVVDAAPVHLFCGTWGVIATGLFTTREGWALTYGPARGDRADECCGLFYGCGFNLLLANLALAGAILLWVGLTCSLLFFTIKATVGLRVLPDEELRGMDLTRHNSMNRGSGGGSANGGGMNAVQRALAQANGGGDDFSYTYGRGIDGGMRSQHSSRAASLSSSKHDDMVTAAGIAVSNGKQESGWPWGHNTSADQHASRSKARLFSHPSQHSLLAEAVTPSVGREGSGYGFNGIGGGRAGEHKVLGVPAGVRPASPDPGQPRSRNRGRKQQQKGWDGGVHETKSEHP